MLCKMVWTDWHPSPDEEALQVAIQRFTFPVRFVRR